MITQLKKYKYIKRLINLMQWPTIERPGLESQRSQKRHCPQKDFKFFKFKVEFFYSEILK